VSITVKPACAG